MRPLFVTALDLKEKHPIKQTFSTDNEYSSFANLLVRAIMSLDFRDLSPAFIKDVAVQLTLYFEDRVADTGIFKAFTSKIKEMYGKVLPFFDIDEQEYYDDEPNLEDVRLIIWYVRICHLENKFANPENPGIDLIAHATFDVMQEHFETISINEELKDFFTRCAFMSDFFLMRNVLSWISMNCYLTSNPNATEDLLQAAIEFGEDTIPADKAFYGQECLYPFTNTCGILALPATEWLSLILKANGKQEEAKVISDIEAKSYEFYLVEKQDKKGVTFRCSDNSTLFVSYSNLQKESEMAVVQYASFVKYKGEWHMNGIMVGIDSPAPFENQKEDIQRKANNLSIPEYDSLMQTSGGSPLFYFKNYDELMKFEKKVLKINNVDVGGDQIDWNKKNQNWTAFIGDEDEPIIAMPAIASSIKDARNPYYDQEIADTNAFEVLNIVPHGMRQYLIEHKMLPDARINSLKGKERGRYLVQENMDFMARAFLRNVY